MITRFADTNTEKLFKGEFIKKLPQDIQRPALRRLLQLDAAKSLDEMKLPPGNKLEPLKGNREGQHSIRINEQWRICFTWHEGNVSDVEVCDYH